MLRLKEPLLKLLELIISYSVEVVLYNHLADDQHLTDS